MHLEGIFSGLSALAMIGWLALALAPLQRTLCITFARILALLLAAAYLAQFFLTTEHVDGGGFSTLAGNPIVVPPTSSAAATKSSRPRGC